MAEKKIYTEAPKKKILDYNCSWPLLIIYIGYLAGMILAVSQGHILESKLTGGFTTPFLFISFLGGVLFTALFYNLGKILFALIGGYRIYKFKLLGFTFLRDGKNKSSSFRFLDFAEVGMKFAPKDDDVNRNPITIFIGGYIFYLIELIVSIVIFAIFSAGKDSSAMGNVGWTMLFACIYGFVILFYEIIPLRQDSATDMFNILSTKTKEDKIAFNMYHINLKRELTGKEFIVSDFDDYNSFYKSHVLYYVYLEKLYAGDLKAAVKVLDQMTLLKKNLDETTLYLAPSEYIYIRYLIADDASADKTYLSLKGDVKRACIRPVLLSNYRSALFLLGNGSLFTERRDEVKSIISEFDKKVASLEESNRVKKEKELFLAVKDAIAKKNPSILSSEVKENTVIEEKTEEATEQEEKKEEE